jgi:signal transduction histidine kinase
LRKTEREELDGALARYATLAAERQSLVETFKSKNALLKNSVNYFPSLVADVLSRTRDPVFVAMVTELRGQTLNLALRDDARLSEAQRQSLSEVMASIPAEFDGTGRRTLELMLAHARVIAREKERTDSLLRQILDVPLDSAREGVSLRYQSYYARARTQAEVFGNFVSGLAVVLLLLVAYAGVRLQRAASELSRSNDRLEAAVAKRTAQLEQAMARREHMEIELRQAQKLETVGQLASGIAHEINTPIQYVGDSVHFLRGAFADVARVLLGYQAALAVTEGGGALLPAFTGVRLLEKEADLESLNTEIPEAFERTLDGTRQVAHIVSSMKTFAHASVEKGPVDLNAALENTLAVARNEYKYVADVKLDLADTPEVTCDASGVRQVFLNLIVNAAHAISDVVGNSGTRGRIDIRIEHLGENVVVSIADTGPGIPEAIRSRIFDPFFTTKPTGKGSGQGLAISRSIVDKHGGKLWFETTISRGTTFFVQLPIQGTETSERLSECPALA